MLLNLISILKKGLRPIACSYLLEAKISDRYSKCSSVTKSNTLNKNSSLLSLSTGYN